MSIRCKLLHKKYWKITPEDTQKGTIGFMRCMRCENRWVVFLYRGKEYRICGSWHISECDRIKIDDIIRRE